jgi:hypothetical protein
LADEWECQSRNWNNVSHGAKVKIIDFFYKEQTALREVTTMFDIAPETLLNLGQVYFFAVVLTALIGNAVMSFFQWIQPR